MSTQPEPRILVVDDDDRYRAIVADGLTECGFETAQAPSVEAAEALCLEQTYDAVLLDIMMPDKSGWDFLLWLRERGDSTPVMFVSARESVEERVRGLNLGADDYIVKPFAFAELVARVEAIVRRNQVAHQIRFGNVELNLSDRTVTCDQRRIDLSPVEFDVLRTLAKHQGKPVSKAELLREVWRTSRDPGTNVVEVHVARIRRKVGSGVIETVRGQGYRMVDEPTPA